MSFKSLSGHTVESSYSIIGKPIPEWTENEKDIESKYRTTLTALQYAEYELIQKRQEVMKLQHENDFMQRLIDKHMIGE